MSERYIRGNITMSKIGQTRTVAVVLLAVIVAIGISAYYLMLPQSGSSDAVRERLIVSTTTSLFDTGLLDYVETDFESKYPYDISFISAGTGLAIQHAENGDADLILVHSPSQESGFMTDGYGVARKIIAYNFFVVAGPSNDPAAIKGLDVKDALTQIVDVGRLGNAVWVSRGDDSGTHTKEKSLWKAAGYNYSKISLEPWYVEAGTGMGATLRLADEKQAYTLSDIGTYLKYSSDGFIQLDILVGEAQHLLNVYSAIAVDPNKVNGVNFEGAITFITYLVSDDAQRLIGDFGQSDYQQPLFQPAVQLLKTDPASEIGQWIAGYAFFNGSECPSQYRAGQDQLYP
jgi:tungstate transport system substrate-binding protein